MFNFPAIFFCIHLHTFEGRRENMTGGVWCVVVVADFNPLFPVLRSRRGTPEPGVILPPPGTGPLPVPGGQHLVRY